MGLLPRTVGKLLRLCAWRPEVNPSGRLGPLFVKSEDIVRIQGKYKMPGRPGDQIVKLEVKSPVSNRPVLSAPMCVLNLVSTSFHISAS